MARSPLQLRLDEEYNWVRAALAKMHPDKAEVARREIITVVVLMRRELKKWEGKKEQLPLYRVGSVLAAVTGATPEELAQSLADLQELGEVPPDAMM